MDLAKQALYKINKIQAERCCGEVVKIIPGSGEAWKLKAVIKNDQVVEILLSGAGEASMPIKERIGLCEMVMLKDPTQLQANALYVRLDRIRNKSKSKIIEKISDVPTIPIKAFPAVQVAAVQATAAFKLPPWVFGASEWNKYFGDVGAEPSLPDDIVQRLPELSKNNVLVLVPATVNGKPLTLKTLGELVQNP